MDEYSIPALAEIPATANLAKAVFRRAAEQPQAVMLRRPGPAGLSGEWTDVTVGQFRDEVTALAKGLIAAGIEAGDRVALMSHTRYEWTLIDYAIWTAGAVAVPVYETSSAEQAEWILSDSGARACFVETAAYERVIDGLRERVPALEHVWRIEPPESGDAAEKASLARLAEAGTAVENEAVTARAEAASASDLATIIYTSGTTGRPKGCELTHRNLLAAVRNAFLGPLVDFTGTEDGGTLLFLPLAHVFARIIEVGCIEAGLVLGHCADLNELLPALAAFRPTFVLAVPRVFEKVYNGAEQKAASERKGAIFSRAARTAIAYSQALDSPGGPGFGLRAQHALFSRLVYAQAAGRARRPGRLRDLRRCCAHAAAVPFLPRRGCHGAARVGTDRDDGRRHRQPAGPEQDRHGRPAAARRSHQDRRGGRDPGQGRDRLPRLLEQRRGGQGGLRRGRLVAHRRHRLARR